MLLILYLGCTTRHRNIPVGYLVQLLVQRHQPWFPSIPPPSLISIYQGCRRTRKLWTRRRHGWRSWWSRREVLRKYHNSHCSDPLGGLSEGLPDLGLFSPTTDVSRFLSISIQIKEIILYFTNCSILISPQHMYFKAL